MRLRTLLALLLGLLLTFTAATIGWLGYSNSRLEIKRFTQEKFAQANGSATHHVIDFLNDPADRLLSEFTLRARRGMLPLGDDRALGFDLAERLRVNPSLAWISYSDAATGHFVGVWRNEKNQVILNVSSPGQGKAREEIVQPDGVTVPYVRDEPAQYDPRVHPWFKNALTADTTVWSPPYTFVDGEKGITASRAWRAVGNDAPVGVFTVDFYLKDLKDLLDETAQNFDGFFSAILEPDGTVISASESTETPALADAMATWLKANPQFKNINGQDTSHLIHLEVGPTTYLAAFDRVNAPSGLKCIVAGMAPKDAIFRHINHAATQMIEVALVSLTLALFAGTFMAYRISEPLRNLGNDLASVGKFQLARAAQPRSVVSEVNQLHDAADLMKSGLRSFIKYVPDDLVRQLLSSGKEATLGGEVRRLTIFFSDIAGFTAHSEKVAPDLLAHELAEYFQVLTQKVRQNSGTIDKFIGDGLLAFFNAPLEVPNHESKACRTALESLQEMALHPLAAGFRTRMGLHSGDLLVGNFGTEERFAYTVLGDPVNVASRLESLNKVYGTQVLASRDVRDAAGSADFEWRHLDRVAVAGRKGGLDIYELMGLKNAAGDTRLKDAARYEEALALYFARNFQAARNIFNELARQNPDDKAPTLMTTRCDHFLAQKLPDDWDGVFAYLSK